MYLLQSSSQSIQGTSLYLIWVRNDNISKLHEKGNSDTEPSTSTRAYMHIMVNMHAHALSSLALGPRLIAKLAGKFQILSSILRVIL